jgi:predicted esterase
MDQTCKSYSNIDIPSTCQASLALIRSYVAEHGPYDAVMAFSQGASVASTFILDEQRHNRIPFRFAVFFSGVVPLDPEALEAGRARLMTGGRSEPYTIDIPTVLVIGDKDPNREECGARLSLLCQHPMKTEIYHPGGHEIPGRRMADSVNKVLTAIRRVANASVTI